MFTYGLGQNARSDVPRPWWKQEQSFPNSLAAPAQQRAKATTTYILFYIPHHFLLCTIPKDRSSLCVMYECRELSESNLGI